MSLFSLFGSSALPRCPWARCWIPVWPLLIEKVMHMEVWMCVRGRKLHWKELWGSPGPEKCCINTNHLSFTTPEHQKCKDNQWKIRSKSTENNTTCWFAENRAPWPSDTNWFICFKKSWINFPACFPSTREQVSCFMQMNQEVQSWYLCFARCRGAF